MQNFSNDSLNGSTNSEASSLSVVIGPDISLLKQPVTASFPVPIAQDPKFHVTFLSSYLKKLWTKHHRSGSAPFLCICSENHCSILELLKALNISSQLEIRLFLQRTEYCLEDYIGNCGGLIKSSGRTKKKLKSPKNSKHGKTSR